jgi:hypothetical protein
MIIGITDIKGFHNNALIHGPFNSIEEALNFTGNNELYIVKFGDRDKISHQWNNSTNSWDEVAYVDLTFKEKKIC